MSKFVNRGAAVTCALLLPWMALAQTADEEGAEAKVEVKAEAKKKNPLERLGMGTKAADKDEPPRETAITADTVDFDRKNGVIFFDENVLVDDAQFIMRSDKLIVFLEGEQDVSQIMAIGNVKITNEMRHATCDKAIYTKEGAQIVMTAEKGKKVVLETKGDQAGTVTGAGVVMWLDDDRVQVLSEMFVHGEAGAEQPRVVIPGLGAFKGTEDKKQTNPDEKKDEKKDN
jgi:lipopolysaccharide export system protein LptA